MSILILIIRDRIRQIRTIQANHSTGDANKDEASAGFSIMSLDMEIEGKKG